MIRASIAYKPIIKALQDAAARSRVTGPLMCKVAGIMLRAVEDNFAEQGRPRWAALKPSTQLGYQVKGKDWKKIRGGKSGKFKATPFEGRILQRSGSLAASIRIAWDANSATVGTNKVYAAIHQFGGRTRPHVIVARNKKALSFGGILRRKVNHPGSNIPARPFLQLTPGDLRDIVLMAQAHVDQSLPK